MHEILAHFGAGFFAKLLGQIIRGRFADKRFPAARRAVKEKTFGRGVLKFLKKIDMQQWKLNCVFDCLKGGLLAADLFPR